MVQVAFQGRFGAGGVPAEADVERWLTDIVMHNDVNAGEITVRLADNAEMIQLNQTYRSKSGSTNVLSFPFEDPPGVTSGILGDIVICLDVVQAEASQQRKSLQQHFAHMVIHGMLHLAGYDHIEDDEARDMEAREIAAMLRLGFGDPYELRMTADTGCVQS